MDLLIIKDTQKNFQRFTPICDANQPKQCTQEQILNTYDNTLYYTDWIVEELIDIAAEFNDYKTAVFYLSDHGESLGENRIYLHGMPYSLAPKEQIHIPAIFITMTSKQTNNYKVFRIINSLMII